MRGGHGPTEDAGLARQRWCEPDAILDQTPLDKETARAMASVHSTGPNASRSLLRAQLRHTARATRTAPTSCWSAVCFVCTFMWQCRLVMQTVVRDGWRVARGAGTPTLQAMSPTRTAPHPWLWTCACSASVCACRLLLDRRQLPLPSCPPRAHV
eukprot:3646669-Rhodomonas_salina.1